MRMIYRIILLLILAAPLCAQAKTAAKIAPKITPKIAPKITGENFKLAAEYSKQSRGHSVLVMQGDKIIFEDYQNGSTADSAYPIFSGTKSFAGIMAIAAQEDKLLKLDEKVADTITEWKNDEGKSKITIRQLLSLTGGIDAGAIGVVPTYSEAINYQVKYDAGTKFQYGPVPFQIFGEVMRRKLLPKKEDVYDYLKRRILDPIGLQVSFWRRLDGQPLLPQGASLTAREWVKFGLLLKNGGKWNGKQLFPKKLLEECVVGTKANPAYGITFWLNNPGGTGPGGGLRGRQGDNEQIGKDGIQSEGAKDLFMAAGALNQRLYVIPSLDLVIVRQGQGGEWDDREFLDRLILGKTPGK
jgi:CubicO group peptidase (beta-lactamase class C family)